MKFKINKGFIVQKVGDKLTIFDPESSMLFTFNETAAFIFERIKKGDEKDVIVKKLCKKYNTTAVIGNKDVEEFLEDLKMKKIIG